MSSAKAAIEQFLMQMEQAAEPLVRRHRLEFVRRDVSETFGKSVWSGSQANLIAYVELPGPTSILYVQLPVLGEVVDVELLRKFAPDGAAHPPPDPLSFEALVRWQVELGMACADPLFAGEGAPIIDRVREWRRQMEEAHSKETDFEALVRLQSEAERPP